MKVTRFDGSAETLFHVQTNVPEQRLLREAALQRMMSAVMGEVTLVPSDSASLLACVDYLSHPVVKAQEHLGMTRPILAKTQPAEALMQALVHVDAGQQTEVADLMVADLQAALEVTPECTEQFVIPATVPTDFA